MEIIAGIILLLAVAWATLSVLRSGAPAGRKALWIMLILLLPLIGILVWLVFGPKRTARRQGTLDI